MDFAAHLAAADRVALQHLGGTVGYMPRAGAGIGQVVNVPGIFDAAYVRADIGEVGVASSTPAVFLRLSDLPSDPEVDDPLITVDGVRYGVLEPKKDGLGGVVLMLREVP